MVFLFLKRGTLQQCIFRTLPKQNDRASCPRFPLALKKLIRNCVCHYLWKIYKYLLFSANRTYKSPIQDWLLENQMITSLICRCSKRPMQRKYVENLKTWYNRLITSRLLVPNHPLKSMFKNRISSFTRSAAAPKSTPQLPNTVHPKPLYRYLSLSFPRLPLNYLLNLLCPKSTSRSVHDLPLLSRNTNPEFPCGDSSKIITTIHSWLVGSFFASLNHLPQLHVQKALLSTFMISFSSFKKHKVCSHMPQF
jgi:hypothetical protein